MTLRTCTMICVMWLETFWPYCQSRNGYKTIQLAIVLLKGNHILIVIPIQTNGKCNIQSKGKCKVNTDFERNTSCILVKKCNLAKFTRYCFYALFCCFYKVLRLEEQFLDSISSTIVKAFWQCQVPCFVTFTWLK